MIIFNIFFIAATIALFAVARTRESVHPTISFSASQEVSNTTKEDIRDIMKSFSTRIGLIANYFITRGESVKTPFVQRTCSEHWQKAMQTLFMIVQKHDFRDDDSYANFEQMMITLRNAADNGSTQEVITLLNSSWDDHKDNGNTILHELVMRRQLRFVKVLLLYCAPFVQWNKQNRKGCTVLDLAYDRLEVEMAQLFLAHGTQYDGAMNTRSSSLGLGEWLSFDILRNIDTGRWLNRESVQSIIESAPGFGSCSPLFRWAYLEVPLFDSVLKELSSVPQLFSISFGDGCDAITNHEAWSGFMRYILRLRSRNLSISAVAGVTPNNGTSALLDVNLEKATTNPSSGNDVEHAISSPFLCDDLLSWLKSQGAILDTQYIFGRTIFYDSTSGQKIAVKLSKASEDKCCIHPLVKEMQMNNLMEELKIRLGLKSNYPQKSRLLLLPALPDGIKAAIATQQEKGFNPFELSNAPTGIHALVYFPPTGYSTYIHDPSLAPQVFDSAMHKTAFDLGALARHGLYHSSLVDLQHDISRENRPHLWSFESFLTRYRLGAGRIEGGFSGFSMPNARASGLADLKHLIDDSEAAERYNPSRMHSQHNILYDDVERQQVIMNELLGSNLFALAMLCAVTYERRMKQKLNSDLQIVLSEAIESSWSAYLQGYLRVDSDRAGALLGVMNVDTRSIANQLMVFCITSRYVEIAETATRRPFFGIASRILRSPLTHLNQSGRRKLSGSYQLIEIQQLYDIKTNHESSRTPRVDTSTMRSSPTWTKGKGWINKHGDPNFGSNLGVFPVQRLIRDIYAVVGVAQMILSGQRGI